MYHYHLFDIVSSTCMLFRCSGALRASSTIARGALARCFCRRSTPTRIPLSGSAALKARGIVSNALAVATIHAPCLQMAEQSHHFPELVQCLELWPGEKSPHLCAPRVAAADGEEGPRLRLQLGSEDPAKVSPNIHRRRRREPRAHIQVRISEVGRSARASVTCVLFGGCQQRIQQ